MTALQKSTVLSGYLLGVTLLICGAPVLTAIGLGWLIFSVIGTLSWFKLG